MSYQTEYCEYMESPLGLLELVAIETGLIRVAFVESQHSDTAGNCHTRDARKQLQEYFDGQRQAFDLSIDPDGTAFQQKVWQQLLEVPFGNTATYGDIANRLNNPKAVRAVGAANGQNPIAIIVPCHRVIGANGTLTGYAGGLDRKAKLLNLENPQRSFL